MYSRCTQGLRNVLRQPMFLLTPAHVAICADDLSAPTQRPSMRFLSLLAVFALAWSCGFASANLNFDKSIIAKFNADVDNWNRALTADYPTKRSLRRTDENDEERKFEQVDDLVEKADDVLGKVAHTSPKVKNSAWAIVKLDGFQAKLNVLKKYPQGLDSKTMAQLAKVEEQRMKDVALLKQMNKKKPDGLQRPMEITPGMKVAPVQVSHVGRDNQRYAEDGSRLLSCVVVSRPAKQGGGDVLLISSSNPNKQEWLLPKGGWDNGESIHKAAWREAIEEGGVREICFFSTGGPVLTSVRAGQRCLHSITR
ncbi:unnamed protein product [Phytophthora lilii]|uniref:Unnamed protein product n=1 Tax=Phytophthora lilii TaxID=2077276 RepID=A0A9W6WGB3_9STRA|nr:unnamed protein product [Phytophthora lilii]